MEFTTGVSVVIAIIVGAIAFGIGYILRKHIAENKVQKAEDKARLIIEEAKKQADTRKKEIEIEAKDLQFKIRQDFENQTKEKRQELAGLEKRFALREENLERKVELVDRKERDLTGREKNLVNKEKSIELKGRELDQILAEEKDRLQKLSGLSQEEAKRLLLSKMESDVKNEAAVMIKRIEDETREEAEKRSRNILSLAIQKCAADHTVESTVSVVTLPDDEMKGRIIGREGRNIRAFEQATGIDVIVDDTPEAVILSGFDMVRREIARIALERLMSDGRIHPARIEEVVEKVKKEMDTAIREEGDKALFDVGIHGVHPEIVKLLGRLKYRTSYGQNVLAHSKEVAYIMGVMAGELGLDVALAKRIGLLHDIGKAVSHEVEGNHAKIGLDLAKKFGESPTVVNAIGSHHHDIEQENIYAVLAEAADAVSASRPGARRETLETYVKRLEKLEQIADSFKGVEKAYAIQAGREIRVIVRPERITDAEMVVLARDIAKKIEEGLEYPGQIKVTVIRETRSVEYAK